MANVKNDRKIKNLVKSVVTLVLLLIMSRIGIIPQAEGTLELTMIDVGQGDSFLLSCEDEIALIDCGTNSAGEEIVDYLQKQGIRKIDYIFGTHPHDDHMGGMLDVITKFEIGKIIIPQIKEQHAQTNWYRKLIKVIKEEGYELEYVELGTVYSLGNAEIKVIGPITDPGNEKNNYSTVLKVSLGENEVIFTGDAEIKVEKDILEYGEDIEAEILKVGHHGSDTSTSEEWLEAINPKYALISCEIGNQHEHPIKEVMQRLKERGIEIYRTDESGTVIATITATNITFNSNPDSYLSGVEIAELEGVDK